MEAEAARGAAGIYPVDVLEDDPDGHREATLTYYASLREGAHTPPAALRFPTGEQVKLEASSVCLCTVYRDDPQHKLLVLVNPQDTKTVVAVYVKESWWCTEDILRTSDPAREGLMEVRAFGERIVLFILNVVIFGRTERSLDDDAMFFLPHSVTERAKILWRNGAAVGFYTTKRKGSLCGDGTGACYLLPVLDTVFVRRKHRRQGLGTAMLRDFCETFSEDEALGVSCPISPAMYQVCRQFLLACPEERGRLWEVEPPGAWGQRTSIWLKVQLQQARVGEWPPAGLYLTQELLGFILQPLVSQCWQVLQAHSQGKNLQRRCPVSMLRSRELNSLAAVPLPLAASFHTRYEGSSQSSWEMCIMRKLRMHFRHFCTKINLSQLLTPCLKMPAL